MQIVQKYVFTAFVTDCNDINKNTSIEINRKICMIENCLFIKSERKQLAWSSNTMN